jgi:AmmeMemoRadiSam system protein A
MKESETVANIPPEDRQALLRIARQALEAAAHRRRQPPLDLHGLSASLCKPGAAFVTLTIQGALRGCIGGLQAVMPLAEDVRQHASAAATEDYRFHPVEPGEIDDIEIEVSVLTDPKPLEYQDPDDLLHLLRPGIDGVILTSGLQRATFLPQVWEKEPDPASFLNLLCEKAGLPRHAWRQGGLDVYTYQVECFQEHERAG